MRFLSYNLKRAGGLYAGAGFLYQFLGPNTVEAKYLGFGGLNFGLAMAGVGTAMEYYQQRQYGQFVFFTIISAGFLLTSVFSTAAASDNHETEVAATTYAGYTRLHM